MLFKELVPVYTENHTKPMQNAAFMTVKAGGIYIFNIQL
jgi:hypothetical protein